MSYEPSPIDNSRIQLSAELTDLIEMLARNNHDLWAKRRIEDGWRLGLQRDDAKKETPLLVPYEDLPESEKHYDRDNAVETLKTILALGGSVEAPKTAAATPARDRGVSGLFAQWHNRKPRQLTLEQYREMGKRANGMGECLIACDIADEGLKSWPADKQLRQTKALALARSGSWEPAREILDQLRKEAHDDEETLGLLARTYKDLWLKTGDLKDLKEAYKAYADAYNHSKDKYWTGINAATLAFAMGDGKRSAKLAEQIRGVCREKLAAAADGEKYWITATLAETELLLGNLAEAEQLYAQSAELARGRIGDLASTRRNARIILGLLDPKVSERIEKALGMPRVAVFTGHRVDAPRPPRVRFPNELAPAVKEAIQKSLVESNARVGYAAASSGSDILFLEAMQAIGGQTHVVLPCHEEQFLRESVSDSGGDWEERFQNVVSAAEEVRFASEQRLTFGSIAYDYSSDLLHGLAMIRAEQLETEVVRMAVWDGFPGLGAGGTADIVTRWQAAGHEVRIIDPVKLANSGPGPRSGRRAPSAKAPAARAKTPGVDSEIRAMLFADAFHFSQLTEEQMPAFIRNFMGPVAGLAASAKPAPLYQNTWGDGLFFVFERLAHAGKFALKLAERVAAIDRKAAGLPETLSLRIALHAGPVYKFRDQIINRMNYIGSHVNRAARIEPVTPPGQVFASDAFAALSALEAPGEFGFEYVGRIPLAKSFGEFPMYRLRGAG